MIEKGQEIVLVTGGCGFIGSHIVDQLIDDGHEVVVLDDLSTGVMQNLNSQAIFYQGDVCDKKYVEKLFKQHPFSFVIHQASKINTNVLHEDPIHDLDSSVKSTIILAENCIKFGVKKIIFASSVAVYGRPSLLPVTELSLLEPIYSYGIAKKCAESYLKYFSTYYGLRYQILRYANVYGPRQPIYGEVGVLAIYTDRLLKGESLIIFGDGSHKRDYIYVTDVVDFTLKTMLFDQSSIFNVGRGIPVTVNQLFSEFQRYDPSLKSAVIKPERYGEIGDFYCDVKKSFDFGWEWQVGLPEGIGKTIGFFERKR